MNIPKIITIAPKKLLGLNTPTSVAKSRAKEIWSKLMPRRKEITSMVGGDLFSVQLYRPGLKMEDFTNETIFTTWAAVEVSDFKNSPDGMETFNLTGGLYAVFVHKGATVTFHKTSAYIFGTWLPNSEYELDERPHFEILGKKFLGMNDPESEEDVYVPIRKK